VLLLSLIFKNGDSFLKVLVLLLLSYVVGAELVERFVS